MQQARSLWDIQSALPEIGWPAVPGAGAAGVLALLFQLEQAQWMPAETIELLQMRQLDALVRHAVQGSPWYREKYRDHHDPGQPLDRERFARLPVLSRAALQASFDAIRSTNTPASHGTPAPGHTSGSTGMPVHFLRNRVTQMFWNAITLRDHLWQRRDMTGKLAVIRRQAAASRALNWGPATDGLIRTGQAVSMSSGKTGTDVDAQIEFLLAERPDYLLTYPSNIASLARRCIERGIGLPGLKQARTLGEIVTDETRKLCREALGVDLADVYSSEEVGYLALQCPGGTHYHIQSESMLVEVLDDAGRPCAPGETGRVVVTSLHNFAFPLLRYDLGDYAEVGSACSCGRGLPVLNRIMGRVRNMLIAPDGKHYWPGFGTRQITRISAIRQFQFVQTARDRVEARLVVLRALDERETSELLDMLTGNFPAGIRFEIRYVDDIPRGAGGKFEDFVSEVSQASAR